MFTLTSTTSPDWREAIRQLQAPLEEKLRRVADEVGREVIQRLKDLSAGDRGWQNRTGALEESYGYETKTIPGGAVLILKVDAPHAIFLEARDGLFVLNGVADRGGPLERALVEAAQAIEPDWIVTYRRG
jgi:hypothetical protein